MNSTASPRQSRSPKALLSASVFLLLLSIFLLAVLGILSLKDATPRWLLSRLGLASQPELRDFSLESWNNSLEQLSYDADIVFIGDSLTAGENFQEYFPDRKIINLGLSGDSLPGIISRSHIISHFTPEMIFLEGGINSMESNTVDDLADMYEGMVREIGNNNPNSRIFIQSILPVSNSNQAGGRTNENIAALNSKLQEIAERNGITYIDLHSVYALNGEMNPEYTIDGIHLKDSSKQLWLEVLSAYINQD